jgi:hypothetical protein
MLLVKYTIIGSFVKYASRGNRTSNERSSKWRRSGHYGQARAHMRQTVDGIV